MRGWQKNEHLEVRPSAKPVAWYIREALQDQHGAYFFDPLVESDDLRRKLVGDLNGYEEPVGTKSESGSTGTEGKNRVDEMIGVKPPPIGYVLSIPMPGCMWVSAPTPPVLYSRPHQVAVAPAKQKFPCKYRDLKLVECWNTCEFGGHSETFRSEATW
eukprot:scaffold48428_cov46-Attheya_sp.AAC.1